eukprot:1102634-Amphidinium_carterae.1
MKRLLAMRCYMDWAALMQPKHSMDATGGHDIAQYCLLRFGAAICTQLASVVLATSVVVTTEEATALTSLQLANKAKRDILEPH